MKRVLLGSAKIGVGIASILMLITFFTVCILPVFATPAATFVNPTPADNENRSWDYVYINITSNETLNQSLLEWGNSTGYTNLSMSNNSQTNWYLNMTSLAEYAYNYTVWAQNTSGGVWNQSTRQYVTVDNIPSVTLISPAANYNSSSVNISFVFNVTDSSSSTLNCSLYINGTLNSTNSSTMNATSTTFQVIGLSEASGQNWTMNCTDDSANYHQPAARAFTVDTTTPTLTSFTCSPSSVYVGDTVTCSCSATDAISDVETTSYTINPSTLIAGTFTTTCTATDYAGNQDSSSASYTVIIRGSGPEPEITPKPDASQSWDKIEPGAAVSMSIEKEGLDFTQIRVEVRNRANEVRLTIRKLAAQPASVVHNVTGRAYQYVEIGKENINDTNVQAASIRFRVNKTWISDNNIDKNKVYMNRYANNQWNRLTTTLVTEDANYVYYSAVTPGFSTFVVTGEIAAQVCTPDAKQCVGNDLQQCLSDGSAWETSETCQYGCDPTNLVCYSEPQPVCAAGTKRCMGDNLEQCSSDGMQWTVSEACTYGCNSTTLACKSAPADYTWLYLVIVVVIIIIIYVAGTKNLRKKLR
jgi:PGF-pre-PGF domain-containing protein